MEEDESDQRSGDSSPGSVSSESSEDVHGFLDAEAVESDDESRDDSQDADDDDEDSPTFHPFGRLPPELRRQIWGFFCREINLKSRLLDITVGPPSERHAHTYSWPLGKRPWTARDGRTLDAMTLSTRRLLAVNHESREIALKAFPDALGLDLASGDAIVRFNKETDVILLTGYGMDYHDTGQYHFPEFAKHIRQLAISATLGYNSAAGDSADLKIEFLRQFPNLKRTFFLLENMQHGTPRNLRWCVPGYVHELFVETMEEAPGVGEDMKMVFCWPNVDEHKTFHDMYRKTHSSLPEDLDQDELEELGIEPYPMAIFQFDSGLAWYKELQDKLAAAPPDFTLELGSSSGDESSEASEPDEYESDGIDDDPVSELDDHSEDELIPDDITAGSGSPSEEISLGQFSSPEPDSPHAAGKDAPRSNGVPQPRALKRRIVSDSEEEDDEVREPRAKRVRVGRGAVLDSSDDEDVAKEEPAPTKRVRSRAVLSDSDESDGGAETGSKGHNNAPVPSESQDDEEDSGEEDEQSGEEESDSEDEEESTPPPISLAERLRRHRQENPIPASDEENSQTQDESEEDVSDEGDDDSEGGGLIDDMAGESDEDDEDGEGYGEDW
jgi:hypothetical protein